METEVAVAFAVDLSGPGQLEVDDVIVWDGEYEARQEQREEAGEVNLLQLLCFTVLNPSRPVQGECIWFTDPQHLYMLRASGENGY